MASVECLSSQQQAGYMCASLSRHSIEESSCIRGGSIYAPGKLNQLKLEFSRKLGPATGPGEENRMKKSRYTEEQIVRILKES